MTDAGFFRGTSAEQDNRFSDKHKKLLKQMKFSDALSLKVRIILWFVFHVLELILASGGHE